MTWSRQSRPAMETEFEEFVVSSATSLRRTAYLMCGDWHRAEDIVQTALARLYVHWARVSNNGGPGPYARRAVVNAAIDESRRPWRRERSVDKVPDSSFEDGATAWGDRDEMARALAHVPPRQRAVIVLRYAEDHDIETTAALLGISPGTVKSQAAKGLAVLRERLSTATSVAGME